MQSDERTNSILTQKTIGFFRSVPAFVWAVTALHFALLLLGSVLQPMFKVPDERYHADMIMVVSQEAGWPEVRARVVGPEIAIATRLLRRDPRLAADAIPRAESRAVNVQDVCNGLPIPTCRFRPELNYFSDWPVRGDVNRMTQHPPLYYVVVATVAHGVQSLFPPVFDLVFDQELWLYRLLTLLMVAPLPLLTFVLARDITEDRSIQYGATALVVVIAGLHIRNGAMINNDNLLLLLAGFFLIELGRIAKGDTSKRTAVVAGLLLGLSLLTKGLALVLIPTLAVAYFLAHLGERPLGRRSSLRSGILSLSIAGVTGGWWWLRNLLHYGTLQPGGAGLGGSAEPGFQPQFWEWFPSAASHNIMTFFGGDTLRRVEAGPVLFWTLVAFIAVGVAMALTLNRRRPHLWLMLLPILLITGVIMLNSFRFYSWAAEVRGVNGRYLYFLLPGLLMILSTGYVLALKRNRISNTRLNLEGFVPVAFLIAGAWLQIRAVLHKINVEWGAPDSSLSASWDALIAWSPLPEPWVTLFVATAVVLFLAALSLAVGFAIQIDLFTPRANRMSRARKTRKS